MSFEPINPNVAPLIHGVKPYLGSSGQVLADGALSLIQLLTSQHGKDAIQTMSKVLSTPGKPDKVISIPTATGSIGISLGLAFALFLILILLILSGSLLTLTMNEEISNEMEDMPLENAAIV